MISALLSDFWPYIATAIAGIAAFLLRRSGAKAERNKQVKRRLEAIDEVRKLERETKDKTNDQILDDISRN